MNNACMSFAYSCGYLGLFFFCGFLVLCILVVGGVTFAYMCDIIVEWVRLCFEITC